MANLNDPLQEEAKIWEELAQQDPFWAVLSNDEKKNGKWNLQEFLETGESDVHRYHSLMRTHLEAPVRFGHLMDFGCGLGRLTLAWSRRCEQVTGVDVSSSMVAKAARILQQTPNASVVVNSSGNLQQFRDGMFDAVTSHICLQHIPPAYISKYIEEFGRVCRVGGIVAFQLPSRPIRVGLLPEIRRNIVEALPFGLGRLYRRWRSGSEVRFRVFSISADDVVGFAKRGGLQLEHQESDRSAGQGLESFIYFFRKTE